MLQPKRLKHRKFQRGRMKGAAQRGNRITKGDYALKAMEPCWMTARQIEAARRAVTHHFKRGGAVWINVFPDKPVTKKPAEVRMGSGKGAPDHWVAVVRPGRVILEVRRVSPALAKDARQGAREDTRGGGESPRGSGEGAGESRGRRASGRQAHGRAQARGAAARCGRRKRTVHLAAAASQDQGRRCRLREDGQDDHRRGRPFPRAPAL